MSALSHSLPCSNWLSHENVLKIRIESVGKTTYVIIKNMLKQLLESCVELLERWFALPNRACFYAHYANFVPVLPPLEGIEERADHRWGDRRDH